MGDLPNQKPKPDWRPGLAIGLSIGTAMGITKVVEKALVPQFGEWGAFGISVIAAAVGAGIVGLIVYTFIRKP